MPVRPTRIIAPLAVLALAACGSAASGAEELRSEEPYEPADVSAAPALEDAVAATSALGTGLVSSTDVAENRVVSPASVAVALAMLAEGADGESLEALEEVLGASGTERAETFGALQAAVLAYDGDPAVVQEDELPEDPVLHLANRIALDDDFETLVSSDFLDSLARHFDAGTAVADLGSDAGKDVLDAWVEEHTGGLIEESAIEPDPTLALVLQNAIVLAARWQMPFEDSNTHLVPFTTGTGEEVEVERMHQTVVAPYAEDDQGQALRLPYSSGFAMDVYFPAPGSDPAALDASAWDELGSAVGGDQQSEVNLGLPQLEVRTELGLTDPLSDLGLGDLFEAETADLTGMTQHAGDGEELFIGQAEHQAVLNVDEEGTVAAAVTELGIGVTSAPAPPEVDMLIDRPYLVRIVHTETGWPLFLAVINDPSAQG
ncbi:serpin family protein [Bogoriella caseilytica]|uniref:Serine protease inhibitor n=1 Tax=Bogoriella caseilytica TaxID=56055 RepID=A0A3N2BGD3_9MICO|nr:serpin family protein [Bogoriella caseilytica]ROR74290.1 serine protease inhibitor [Bogoriella caseilytica]